MVIRLKISWLALFACIPCLANCEDPEKPADVKLAQVKLSSHPRAAAAAARVRPAMERDLSEKGLHIGDPIFIRAFKEERILELFVKNRDTGKYDLFRTYPIAGQSGDLGPKLAEGDGQVPEGFYFVSAKSMNPNSMFHLSFNIGYPNSCDTFHKRTGSHIMIHGNNISIGCLAMTDEKIEEIFTLADACLRNGREFFRVHIFPFRMTPGRMAAAAGNPNEAFWKNLKEGYDRFESDQVPPDVSATNGNYVFKTEDL
jgi:murein L,D-transpeptidase YafK